VDVSGGTLAVGALAGFLRLFGVVALFKYICKYLNTMDQFSISQLSRFAGIKPHTVRIWEQRYNALQPVRSDGNTRYYDGNQLRRLLNIVSLRSEELELKELCGMSDKALFKLVEEQQTRLGDPRDEYFVSQLISAGMSFDEGAFSKLFSLSLLQYGVKDTYLRVVYPMLVRMGTMWASDGIRASHEHFISSIIRRKLSASIDQLSAPVPGARTWMLFLPENEFHDIGLLFADYLIRSSGAKTVYLGGNMPVVAVLEAMEQCKPDHLLLFLVHRELSEEVTGYLERLAKAFKGHRIYVSGSKALSSLLPGGKKVELLTSPDELGQKLKV
jgi:MerR family transcriptional regulator, light-induced transcriptional regulator